MLPYVYYIRNIITGQFYYGSRYKNVKLNLSANEDLWINYFSSSKQVTRLIQEHGIDSFETQVLKEDDYDTCYWAEQKLIADNIKNPLCLNKRYINPVTKKNCFSFAGQEHTTETKSKISQSQLGSKNSFYNKKHTAKNNKTRIEACVKARTGSHHSVEAKEKARQTMISKSKVACPHCQTLGHQSIMKRWHFENCRNKVT